MKMLIQVSLVLQIGDLLDLNNIMGNLGGIGKTFLENVSKQR